MSAWEQLLQDENWCRGEGRFPMAAYSEFMPPPWIGVKPYGGPAVAPRPPGDDWGWDVVEYEEEQELSPGLELIARATLAEVVRLGSGKPTPHLSRAKLRDNPYWPPELAARAGRLGHERYVLLLAAALSRTQDDKGRVRWTLFGASEQGPARPFWRSFFTAPDQEAPAEDGLALLAEILAEAYDVPPHVAADPAGAGLRVLPAGPDPDFPFWDEGPLPSWCAPLLWREGSSLEGVRFLLTFRPFGRLPSAVQQAYADGDLHLLPFPGSLVFWGAPLFRRLQRELPFAVQVPLLHLFARSQDPSGLRVPQSGWLHEKVRASANVRALHRPEFVRTHRWQKVARHVAEATLEERGDRVVHVLFSTDPDDLGLYGKPMARNVQLWTREHRLLLDGLRYRRGQIERAERAITAGGAFGYRFVFPAMRVGPWEVYWHRPVAAFAGNRAAGQSVQPTLLLNAPTGYLTAYRADDPDLASPVELWPRLLHRPPHAAATELFAHENKPRRWATTSNVRALLEWSEMFAPEPLPRTLARALLALPRKQTLEDWLATLPDRASDPVGGRELAARIEERLGPAEDREAGISPASLTFAATATRDFEVSYWKTIATLAHGRFRNKDNADCVRDDVTRAALAHQRRDLEALGRYLIEQHAAAIDRAGSGPRAWVGEHVFSWRTDFAFDWSGGWAKNQKRRGQERNIVVRIPGRNSTEAVIMADHYDTAYMEDHYDARAGGPRVAAAGADDNHSATAALLLAAPILLELSKAGRLGCDVWLVHLTGEEFPSDCLGARHLCQALVEGTLKVTEPGGPTHDLSGVRVRGVYLSDMIAHNNDRNRFVFQAAPGEGLASSRLALAAHKANLAWNALARQRNQEPPRRGARPFQRCDDPDAVPALAPYAVLHGEVRSDWESRSTLYNTDGQIFSDAGVPVVLFMEDYDINRHGYHDSHDTMANIDLDYGAALAAIFIESAARAASPGQESAANS